MNHTEVKFTFSPFDSIYPDLLSVSLAEIGFDTFRTEEESLFAYIRRGIQKTEIECVVNSFFIPDINISFETKEIEEQNWNEEWEKTQYEPIIISDLCAIHASHHTGIPQVKHDITINPRMAFGSGAHETTSLLTEILLSINLNGKTALDMGCGTGILAIAMALNGAKKVYAIDIDEKSVANSRENIELNHLTNIEALQGDATTISSTNTLFDIIVANIHKNIIINDMHHYVDALSPEGTLMVSGFYSDDANDIQSKAEKHGLNVIKSYTKNGWCVLLLKGK